MNLVGFRKIGSFMLMRLELDEMKRNEIYSFWRVEWVVKYLSYGKVSIDLSSGGIFKYFFLEYRNRKVRVSVLGVYFRVFILFLVYLDVVVKYSYIFGFSFSILFCCCILVFGFYFLFI